MKNVFISNGYIVSNRLQQQNIKLFLQKKYR